MAKKIVTDNTDTDVSDVPAKAFVDELRARRAQCQLAIKLHRTYEFAISSDGTPSVSNAKPIVHHSWTVHTDTTVAADQVVREYPLSHEGNFNVSLPVGVTAVLGRSGSGKSRLTFDHLFATVDAKRPGSIRYIKMFEPGNDEKILNTSRQTSIPSYEIELAVELAAHLNDPKVEVIIVDSLRYLFYSSEGGATGKGGVNMALFMDLTHLDALAAAYGKSLIVVINPMTDDESAFNFYVEAAVGAVSGVIIMRDFVSATMSNRYSIRDFKPFRIPRDSVMDVSQSRRHKQPEHQLGIKGGKTSNLSTDLFDRK